MKTIVLSEKLPIPSKHPIVLELKKSALIKIGFKSANLKNAVAIVSLLTDRIDRNFLDKAPHLKIIANYAVGYNNVDLVEASKRGIRVCNTPGALTNATAELAIGLIFAAARNFRAGFELIQKKKFKGWSPSLLLGSELAQSTLGIVGAGRIGSAVAKKAQALGMNVMTYSKHDSNTKKFEKLLQNSDFISIHCPLTPETENLLGKKEFAQMKRGSHLINTARGEVVDEKALLWALQSGILSGAALDVFCGEPILNRALRAHPKVFVIPHLGSATHKTRRAMAELALHSIHDLLSGRKPRNCVN